MMMPFSFRWIFFKIPLLEVWVFPLVDGLVGSIFLADWLYSMGQAAEEGSEACLKASLSLISPWNGRGSAPKSSFRLVSPCFSAFFHGVAGFSWRITVP